MRYRTEIKPHPESFDFLIRKNYCDFYTVLNVYSRDNQHIGTFRTLSGLIIFLKDKIFEDWSSTHPHLLNLSDLEFQKAVYQTFKNYLRGRNQTYHGYRILLEYKQKYIADFVDAVDC